MKFTYTRYCSCDAGPIGSADNQLVAGKDVAVHRNHKLHPIKKDIGKAEFTYIRFGGREYRVADVCKIDEPMYNVDIYQGKSNICKCDNNKDPSRAQQNGGYELQVLYKKIEFYEDKSKK